MKAWIELFKLSSQELLTFLATELSKYGYEPVQETGYLYAKGSIPIMVCAHVDTVHSDKPTVILHGDSGIMWSPQGLGADDRAGVIGILMLLQRGLKPHVLFTDEEEVGCIGAKAAAKALNPKVNYIIELDRQGEDDCVFYQCDSKVFTNYVKKFGFKFEMGSMSDISHLCPAWGIAGVNLSVGYFNQHTKAEYLVWPMLVATVNKVEAMLKSPPRKPFAYVAKTFTPVKVIPTRTYAQPYYGYSGGDTPITNKPPVYLHSLYLGTLCLDDVVEDCKLLALPVDLTDVQSIMWSVRDEFKKEVMEIAVELACHYVESELDVKEEIEDVGKDYWGKVKSIE